MDLLEQLKQWFGKAPSRSPEAQGVRTALEEGRRAKFAEDYARALEQFGQAIGIAREARDTSAVAAVALHQVDVLTRLEEWDEAEQLLASIQQTSRASNQMVQVSYVLSASGTLAQERGDWTAARTYYEQALTTAKNARSAGAEGRALGHLADTYLHEGNASYAMHLLREALPKLNTSGDIELSSYFVGLLGQAMIQSGQDVEGQHLLARALQLAEHIHYHYYERLWSLVLGERALSEARAQDAVAHYEKALKLFPDGMYRPAYAEALRRLSQAHLSLREYEPAIRYAEQANTLLDDLSESQQAAAHWALGAALRGAGRSPESIPHLQAAAEIYARVDSENASRIEIETLRSLAAAQADAGEETAIATYRRAIEKAQRLDDGLELAQARRDLGLLYANRGEGTLAIQEWSAALGIYEDKKHHAQMARLYTDIANARKKLGQRQRSMKDYEQALMALNSVDENDLETRGLVYSNAATAFVDQGDIESSDSFFLDAITIAEKTGDFVAESTRRGNYGWYLLTVGRPRRAVATLEQALRLSRTHNLSLQAAVQTSNLGLAHDSLGEYPAALAYHRQAFELSRALDEPHWRAQVEVNLANNLLSLGEHEEARPLLESALAHGRSVADKEILIMALTGLARLNVLQGQPETARPLLDEAQALARRSDQRRLLAEVLSVQSEQRAALGQEAEAAAAWDEAQRAYAVLHMPQAKLHPAWLGDKTVKP
jgi:tetratricopeptide (TPR) repeat protein